MASAALLRRRLLDLAIVVETDLPRLEQGRELAGQLDETLPVVVPLLVYTPEEFAAGEARRLRIFDAFRREGVEILWGFGDGRGRNAEVG